MKKPVIVEIEWRDGSLFSGQHSIEAARGRHLLSLRSVGYLVRRDVDEIVLAEEWHEDWEEYRHVHVFPASEVKKVRRVR